jgi:hypothetical protein
MTADDSLLSQSTEALQVLYMEGRIQAFGVKVAVTPYTYHTPAMIRFKV